MMTWWRARQRSRNQPSRTGAPALGSCRPETDPDAVRRFLTGGTDVALAVSERRSPISPMPWRALAASDRLDVRSHGPTNIINLTVN